LELERRGIEPGRVRQCTEGNWEISKDFESEVLFFRD